VALYGHGSGSGGARKAARITFASDAHTTDALAGNFYEATAMAEHFAFCQGRHPVDFWTS
jgi:hypothetical protein